jgi:hypothetical protein
MRRKKTIRDLAGHELRQKVEAGDEEAIGELNRRRGNMKGALIPYWEER